MNGSSSHARLFLDEIAALMPFEGDPEVVIFPPFTLLAGMSTAASACGIGLGGQDIYWEEKGAFTGEISPSLLEDAGCTWFLAGHSERRHVLGEDDAVVRRKFRAGLDHGLRGILCVGELEEERRTGRTEEVVRAQVESGLSGLDSGADVLAIAYEPVWAIGTGLTATPEEAQRMHALVRGWTGEMAGEDFSSSVRIIYGGSVKPGNAAALMAGPDVDGALVGGASLEAGSFAAIASAGG